MRGAAALCGKLEDKALCLPAVEPLREALVEADSAVAAAHALAIIAREIADPAERQAVWAEVIAAVADDQEAALLVTHVLHAHGDSRAVEPLIALLAQANACHAAETLADICPALADPAVCAPAIEPVLAAIRRGCHDTAAPALAALPVVRR